MAGEFPAKRPVTPKIFPFEDVRVFEIIGGVITGPHCATYDYVGNNRLI